ncbi:MFS transporter [Streptomyces sp. LP11]|uniref:MFS transporter n=1 Tax=Streptomyces pyxinicus TaxID=2970331 RepID=A0ABT2AX81_9ACTN|nr:MFS transporter [Streptomyces sp. LP11]MCS0600857.1 MFS transporter [Streptomyces sp. LP11]
MPQPPSSGPFRVGLVYLYTGLTELLPLHAVYALSMTSHGVSTGELSVLFAVWTVTTFVCEVPSGALADRFPRHRVLAAAALAQCTGFALWTALPSLGSFAAGFVLWGAGTALTSGTLQSLVYDGLAAEGRAGRYAHVSSRVAAVQACSVAASSLAATPLVLFGGYPAAGWVSVLFTLLAVPTALGLGRRAPGPVPAAAPEPDTESGREPDPRPDPGAHPEGYLAVLRAGLAEARTTPRVRSAALLAAALTGLAVVDEYLPVLAREAGTPAAAVPLLLLLPWAAMAAGGFAGGRMAGAGDRLLAVLLGAGGAALAAGALTARPAGFLGIAAFYWVLRLAQVVADTRLQHAISGPARATVTSVAGLGAQAVALAVFLTLGLAARWASAAVLVALTAVPVLLLAVRLALRPAPAHHTPPPPDDSPRPARADAVERHS